MCGSGDQANPMETEQRGVEQKAGRGRLKKRPPAKPAYSYISLICMAITSATHKQATLKVRARCAGGVNQIKSNREGRDRVREGLVYTHISLIYVTGKGGIG